MYVPYTGAGFERAPESILNLIAEVSYLLSIQGHTLRVGAYRGCSAAFRAGVNAAFRKGVCGTRPLTPKLSRPEPALKEVYLPYRGYEGHHDDAVFAYEDKIRDRIFSHLKKTDLAPYISAPRSAIELNDVVARVYQLLGNGLNRHSKFVLCWTPDAATKFGECDFSNGSTFVTIALAEIFKIPVYNMCKPRHFEKIVARVDDIKHGIIEKK